MPLVLRFHGWRVDGRHAAFRSLYYAYRHGHCPYFYVRSARHTAVFYKVGTEWRAAMARSKHEFRKILHEDGAFGSSICDGHATKCAHYADT